MNEASSPAQLARALDRGATGRQTPAAFAEPAERVLAPCSQPRHHVRRAPVECGDLPFLIRRDGTWLYRGSPINRKELVCLFASVLKREADGSFYLETPAERGRIEVEDAPFVAVELDWAGDGRQQALSFRTNVDKVVTAGPDHPIRIAHVVFNTRDRETATTASRHASTAPSITNWWRLPCRNGSAAGACSASGVAANSSRSVNCRPAKSDPSHRVGLP